MPTLPGWQASSMQHLLASCLLVLAALVTSGTALACYTCDTFVDNACGDPISVSDAWPRACSVATSKSVTQEIHEDYPGMQGVKPQGAPVTGIEPVCVKSVFTKSGKKSTFRGCSYFGEANTCNLLRAATEADGGKLEFCQTCKKDLCNAAPALLTSPVIFLVLLTLLVLRFQ